MYNSVILNVKNQQNFVQYTHHSAHFPNLCYNFTMEFLILIVTLLILAETTYLTFFKNKIVRTSKRKIYVDTSALIDGRILNVARTNFMMGDELIILKSVLRELQLLADGKDLERRTRARAGLEVASELERVTNVTTEIINDNENDTKHIEVDEQLLKLAREEHGIILTLDYNLIKVAEAEKIPTLNINELSLAVRTEFLAGEVIRIKIVEKGANPGQGVGHLTDGTMVVVDNGASKLGTEVSVKLLKFHETPSGRMIFAKLYNGGKSKKKAKTIKSAKITK